MTEDLEERIERIEEELGIEPEPEEFVLRAEAPEHGGTQYFKINENLTIEDNAERFGWSSVTVRGDSINYHSDYWNVSDVSIVPRSEVEE